jgi:hypothetical protein
MAVAFASGSINCSHNKYPARNPVQNINDPKAQIAATAGGRAQAVVQFTLKAGRPTCSRAGQRGESGCRVIDALRDLNFHDGPGHRDHVKITVDRDKASHRRLHRHVAAAADQFQRTGTGDARGGALRVPGDGQ